MQVMITNGGPHPADKWAATTAKQITDLIQVDPASESEEAVAARKALPRFTLDLADALESHHHGVQRQERDLLKEHGHLRHKQALHPGEPRIQAAVKAVADAAAKTPFASHFAQPGVQKVVRDILGSHMETINHIERMHHAARTRPDQAS